MDWMLEETQDKQRQTIEEEFWRRHQDRLEWRSQYKPLTNIVLQKAQTLADKEGLDASGFEEKLHEAESIVEDITEALRAFWEDPPDDKFWYRFDNSQLINRPEEWTAASPINPTALDAATSRYLERPWMQSNLLDWYLLNGFLTDEMFRFQDGLLSGSALGETNWAYQLSKKTIMSALWWRVGLGTAKFALSWLLLPALAAVAYYFDYILAAQLILGMFGVLVIFRIIFFPSRFMRRRERKHKIAELRDGFDQLVGIQVRVNDCSTLNPTVLREQLNETEREGALVVRPAVYSILDRAIARDPAVFTKNDTPETPLR